MMFNISIHSNTSSPRAFSNSPPLNAVRPSCVSTYSTRTSLNSAVRISTRQTRRYVTVSEHNSFWRGERKVRNRGHTPPRVVSADEAIARTVVSRSNVFVHTAAAAPPKLVQALIKAGPELSHVTVNHLHVECDGNYAAPAMADHFWANCFFTGSNMRKPVQAGATAGFVPMFLSEVPDLFATGRVPIDVALIQVSPPDRHGHVSLGCSVDVSIDAAQHAKYIIAQVNPQMPRTHGHGVLHINQIDYLVESDEPIFSHTIPDDPIMDKIGQHVASLVEDRACLQLGIGALSNSVCKHLSNHRDLGLHSEMVGDGVVDLINHGVITNRYKQVIPDVNVVSFAMGSKPLYDLLDDNLSVQMLRTSFTNDPEIVRRNKKMTAINSAIEIDVTGQVCADSIGTKIYSGIGGQLDCAAQAEDGKAILALPSMTANGISKIVPTLKPGAGVEHGIAYLWGKNLQQRAKALIDIAHPSQQEALEKAVTETYGWPQNWMIHWQQTRDLNRVCC